VTNNGRSNATNVTIRDVLPQGLTLVDGDLEQVIPFLAANGGNYTFTVKAKTTGVGNFTNDVTVSCYENGTNKSANATVYVFAPELVINKTVDNSSVLVNDLVNFTIVIKNIGKGNATNVNITDELDSAFKLINATGSYAQTGNVVVWNVVLLAFFVVQTVVKMEVVVEEGVAQKQDVAVVVKMDVVLEDVALFATVFVLLEDVAMIPVVQKDVVLVLIIKKFY
jgi:uncharacterized repeat protein (TIGR01451 family)